jgi:hypothetical protein
MEVKNGAMSMMCGPVAADWHHFYQEQNPDPHPKEYGFQIRIRINAIRIRDSAPGTGIYQIL